MMIESSREEITQGEILNRDSDPISPARGKGTRDSDEIQHEVSPHIALWPSLYLEGFDNVGTFFPARTM
jgi:hypothetical protein